MGEEKRTTMSIEDAVARLRREGMKISPLTLRAGLEQGKFPFGTVVDTTEINPVHKRGRTTTTWIYVKPFEAWIAANLGGNGGEK